MGNALLTLLSAEQIKRYYAAGHWRDDTIFSLVRDHARRTPQKPALRAMVADAWAFAQARPQGYSH